MKTQKLFPFAVVTLCVLCTITSQAQDTLVERLNKSKGASSRDITIEKVDNDKADFAVLTEVDRADATYREGDLIHFRVKSSKAGYLYLVHISSTGKETLLIPNEHQKDNRIEAKQTTVYPAGDADFVFRVSGPNFGSETIKAIVTDRPLKSVDVKKFTKAPLTALDENDAKSLVSELMKSKDIEIESKPGASGDIKFATHQASYLTRSKSGSAVPASKPKRFAICFGLQKYRDPRITPLSVSSNDAKAFAKLLVQECGVHKDNCLVLTDDEVTLEKVKHILCNILPDVALPGSEIFVYWSGHGGRMSATRTDNSSTGYVEYLVPYDGKLSDPGNTMLLEGPFGEWVQRLSGRKLFFVLDACHSGGMTVRAKNLGNVNDTAVSSDKTLVEAMEQMSDNSKSVSSDDTKVFTDFSFGFTSSARSKALGQKDLAVLASSSYDQLSWERDEGDLSVMTYFLIKAILDGPRTMTHKDIKADVRTAVDRYVSKNHPNTRQTVVEQDDLTPGLILKP